MISVRDAFWFAGGLLSAFAAGFVLVPLFVRAGQRATLTALKWPVLGVLVLALPALALYAWRGSPDQVGTAAARMIPGGSMAAPPARLQSAGSMDAMLSRLERRLAGGGGSASDWELLAKTYDFLGRKEDADKARTAHVVAPASATPSSAQAKSGALPGASDSAVVASWATDNAVNRATSIAGTSTGTQAASGNAQEAPGSAQGRQLHVAADSARRARNYGAAVHSYEQLVTLGQMSAQDWADYADVSASVNGGSLQGLPEQYIDAALKLEPLNEKALWLRASAQHAGKRYAQAVSTWKQLLALAPAGSADVKIFAANLAEDEQLAVTHVSAARAGAVSSDIAAVQVNGEVALADALKGKVHSGLTLFIVARSLDSPGAPVAVVRAQTGQWPLRFTLDDSLAMLPDRKLSGAGRVTVQARVSQDGTAATQAGDFQSAAATIDPRERKPVRLIIDHVIG